MQILWAFCERVRRNLATLGPDDPKTIDAKEALRLVFALLKADEKLDNARGERDEGGTSTQAKVAASGPSMPSPTTSRRPKTARPKQTKPSQPKAVLRKERQGRKPKADQPSGIKIRIRLPQPREQTQVHTGTQPGM